MRCTKQEILEKNYGSGISVTSKRSLSGGDINAAYALTLSNGETVFLKENSGKSEAFFLAEAEGLRALSDCQKIKTPPVLGVGSDSGGAFLMLGFIESGPRTAGFSYAFGRSLALLHKSDPSAFSVGKRFGFTVDNFIGATPQENTPSESWISFFRDCRLAPQFKMAWGYFDNSLKKKCDHLLENMDRYLTEPDYPSLLHGDLWGGNYMINAAGEAVLIDPAAYVGNAEADIAMTELFGGFDRDFYRGYYDERPLVPGYGERRDLYNLYHLTNHLNLFGPGYLGSVRRILEFYG